MIFGFQVFISVTLMIENLKKGGFHMDLQLPHFLSKKCMVPNPGFALISYNLRLLLLFSLQDISRNRVLMTVMLNRTIESLNDKKLYNIWNVEPYISCYYRALLRISKKYHFLGCFLPLGKEKILRSQISFIKCPIYRNILPPIRPYKSEILIS